ncbi:MAG: aldo/keto reductase [Chloroflexi bacterium]|nr:aldo/keto reductase [Chloroflexota bacterium]
MDPTERVPLGKTGLTVTRLGLGGAPLGGLFHAVDDGEAHAVVRRAFEMGLRLFDTAPLYGHGTSEARMGHVLSTLPRAEFTLATKVGRLLREGAPPYPRLQTANLFRDVPNVNPVFDFSEDGVLWSVEESLKRLGMDRVDILHIHDPEDYQDEALTGAYRALDRLRREGTIGAVGAGMNFADVLARMAREADFDCFLVAGRYSILDQRALPELLPLCVEKRIAVIIGGVYNSGILADPREGATFNYEPADRPWLEKAQRLRAVCDRHDVPLKAAAIQFPLAHPAVASVLTGVRSVAELDENVRMFRFPIPSDLWQELRAEGLLPEEAPVPVA